MPINRVSLVEYVNALIHFFSGWFALLLVLLVMDGFMQGRLAVTDLVPVLILGVIIYLAAKYIGYDPSAFANKKMQVEDSQGRRLFNSTIGIPRPRELISFAASFYLLTFIINDLNEFYYSLTDYFEHVEVMLASLLVVTLCIGILSLISNQSEAVTIGHRATIYPSRIIIMPFLFAIPLLVAAIFRLYEDPAYQPYISQTARFLVGFSPLAWMYELFVTPLLAKLVR
jgi:hypothetical protein